ncbi:hypothetical protein TBR22_A35960 [Luteitalea sp. TBR-22]|uniref:hypothetical protein n=1 Tax=Luteitalea sp. TBR-22 TaxID=2802971 RepID=UPI001AFC90D4|nr:hypothetical protein [Luteitalea sp. TBR-22]BCS34366.1 hypothetical protein TBR22_A35960 [Luteitalea sp. TBR-22]
MASSRRSFLLRIDPAVLDAVQRWANDDLRSLNGQVEFLLRRALADAGREPRAARERADGVDEDDEKRST